MYAYEKHMQPIYNATLEDYVITHPYGGTGQVVGTLSMSGCKVSFCSDSLPPTPEVEALARKRCMQASNAIWLARAARGEEL